MPDTKWACRYDFDARCRHLHVNVQDIETCGATENGEIVRSEVLVALHCHDCGGLDYAELDLLRAWPRAKQIRAYVFLRGVNV